MSLLLIPLKVVVRVFIVMSVFSAINIKRKKNGTFWNPFKKSFWAGEEKSEKEEERQSQKEVEVWPPFKWVFRERLNAREKA